MFIDTAIDQEASWFIDSALMLRPHVAEEKWELSGVSFVSVLANPNHED